MAQQRTERERLGVVAAYVTTTETSIWAVKLAGVPASTIRGWRKQEWWSAAEDKVRIEIEGELLANISEIVDAGRKEMLDRIQNGDYCYKK